MLVAHWCLSFRLWKRMEPVSFELNFNYKLLVVLIIHLFLTIFIKMLSYISNFQRGPELKTCYKYQLKIKINCKIL